MWRLNSIYKVYDSSLVILRRVHVQNKVDIEIFHLFIVDQMLNPLTYLMHVIIKLPFRVFVIATFLVFRQSLFGNMTSPVKLFKLV